MDEKPIVGFVSGVLQLQVGYDKYAFIVNAQDHPRFRGRRQLKTSVVIGVKFSDNGLLVEVETLNTIYKRNV